MTTQPFSRVAIINRGEPAVRFLRALDEFNLIHNTSIKGIALYTEPDEHMPFVRQADEAVCIGGILRPQENGKVLNAYCDHDWIIEMLHKHQCDAVWPGWGFVSEDPIFVQQLEQHNIVFLGPSSDAMSQLGDKIAAKYLAEKAGVPLAPWSEYKAEWTLEELLAEGERIGYPLMVKASAGGGGRGIRKVKQPENLQKTIETVQSEVEKFFGQGGILLERCVSNARHIEVQLVCTSTKAHAVGIRDCSIQRKNQKVIEEAPSPILPEDIGSLLMESSENLAQLCNYKGVATAEFLYEPMSRTTTFLEVNSRLQVEHTITEAITGTDLVQAQISIALGWAWTPPVNLIHGHAIELRVNAEDPEKDFRPAPGRVAIFRPPAGPGIRIDSGVTEGSEISEHFDSMIAKIIIWAPTRELCIARARRACLELDAAVEDGATNQAFLLDILRHDEFVQATASTDWLDRAMAAGSVVRVGAETEALLAAAILEYKRHTHANVDRFFQQCQDGIPVQFPSNEGHAVELRLRGTQYSMLVGAWDVDDFVVEVSEQLHRVQLKSIAPHIAEMWIGEQRHKILYSYGSAGITVELDGYSHTIERSSGGIVKSPTPAVIVGISVSAGDVVHVGDRLCTLEAMKMELGVFASESGTVREILCQVNQQVLIGDSLLVLELEDESEDQSVESQGFESPHRLLLEELWNDGTIDLQRLDTLGQENRDQVIEEIHALFRASVLGFDITPAMTKMVDQILESSSLISNSKTPAIWNTFIPCLEMFADSALLLDRNALLDLDSTTTIAAHAAFYDFCRQHHDETTLECVEDILNKALHWYHIESLKADDWLKEALFRLALANDNTAWGHHVTSGLLRIFIRLHQTNWEPPNTLEDILEKTGQAARAEHPYVQDNAIHAHHLFFAHGENRRHLEELRSAVHEMFASMESYDAKSKVVRTVMRKLGRSPQSLQQTLYQMQEFNQPHRIIEALTRRFYIGETYEWQHDADINGHALVEGRVNTSERILSILFTQETTHSDVVDILQHLVHPATYLEFVVPTRLDESWLEKAPELLMLLGMHPKRITLTWMNDGLAHHRTFVHQRGQWRFQTLLNDIHPQVANRLHLEKLQDFNLKRIYSQEHIYAFLGHAHSNKRDERIFVLAEVFGSATQGSAFPLRHFERVFFEAVRAIRSTQSQRSKRSRIQWNWLYFHIHPQLDTNEAELQLFAKQLEPYTRGLNLREVQIHVRTRASRFQWSTVQLRRSGNNQMEFNWLNNHLRISPMSHYDMKVVRAQKFGHVYPYDIIRMLEGSPTTLNIPHPDMQQGRFQEYDMNVAGQLTPVLRPFGQNDCGVVIGLINNITSKFPQGMQRVWIGSDSTKAMGSLAEKECVRIIAALDLAEELQIPVEWVPISAGAMIAMDSGTENLDWTARVLERIIRFTQKGGTIHVIVHGINVGAQSYWNAEATMLMHTKGVLIMTTQAAMVLTGKKALDFSGGVSAEDERGIGGVARIMGPNGQAQYRVSDLEEAYTVLFEVYRHTFSDPKTGQSPKQMTNDSKNRNICLHPYSDSNHPHFSRIGDIFSKEHNPERKKPFAIRQVMRALIDQDSPPLERFAQLHQGESAVVWSAHIGGISSTVVGIESQPILRRGRVPLDGPDTWTGGTLFPQSSKKIARAINAASGQTPVVVLANLSGFDGSPESLRRLQLEFGAEIGRAVVNCESPIVFVVIGRYHGGAYVVFSKALNPNITAIAVNGSFASVIGGAPAAAVVFPRKVRQLVNQDPRLVELDKKLSIARRTENPLLLEERNRLANDLTLEKRGVIAAEFDAIHSVQRAIEVGSLDAIIEPNELRPRIIEALERSFNKQDS